MKKKAGYAVIALIALLTTIIIFFLANGYYRLGIEMEDKPAIIQQVYVIAQIRACCLSLIIISIGSMLVRAICYMFVVK